MKKILLIIIGIIVIISVQLVKPIIELLKEQLPAGVELIAFSPTDSFIALTSIVFILVGIFLTPIILIGIIKITKPAMYKKEKDLLIKLIPISSILFFLGATLGIIIMLKFGLVFFAQLSVEYGMKNMWSLGNLINSIAYMGFLMGLTFQLPIIIITVVNQKLISLKEIVKLRKFVILGALVVSAIVTPPDIISQLTMAIPLILLYEGTIYYIRKTGVKSC